MVIIIKPGGTAEVKAFVPVIGTKVFFIFINLVLLNFLIYNGGKSLYVNGIIGIIAGSINIFEEGFYNYEHN